MLPVALHLSLALAPAAQQPPECFPVALSAVATPVDRDGAFTLRLACRPQAELAGQPRLRVALSVGNDDLFVVDLELEPPVKRWEVGRRIDLAYPLALPFEAQLLAEEILDVRVGFLVGRGDDVLPAGGAWADLADADGLAVVTEVAVPRFAGPAGRALLEAELAEARALRSGGRAPQAWSLLVEDLRAAADDRTKEQLRDALIEVGRFAPAPPSEVEQMIVGQRIRAEQVRVYREEAGRMYDRGELFGALRLLELVGGALAVDADEAVLGALADAERTTRRVEDLRERLLSELPEEDQALVTALVEEHGRTEALLEEAEELARDERVPPALALYRKLRRVDGIELYDRAQERLEEVGEAYLTRTPPEQAEKVRAVVEHPAWDRTASVASHEFLFIGPRRLVEHIPDDSKLRFDLAYAFLTDLFGRRPNPDGDRVTVYFKELWDFGGGVGGGKIIDIGRAEPEPREPVRVDNGLLYHELTHCVDDTLPIHAGFREGLANLGAAYTFEALDQDADALHSFEGNLRQFRSYYLQRDLEYWRIQNYGPSAGLLLHFVDEYSSRGRAEHDWSPLRRFFREYREAYVRDGREPSVVRSLAFHLERAFGPRVFDDLAAFRFPLAESDRDALGDELLAFAGDPDLEPWEEGWAEHPNSPLPRDVVQRELATALRRGDRGAIAELQRALGIVTDWKVIGPFFARSADPGAHVFPPELEIDFDDKPATLRSNRRDPTQLVWQDPLPEGTPGGGQRSVILHPDGWLHFDYEPYGDDNAAIYALTHVTVDEATDALAHLRVDDDVALFVNDRRAGSYRARGSNGSSRHAWRGPWRRGPDAIRFPVRLEAGRNRVLVKVRNRGGTAGVVAAFSRPDGSPLAFEADAGPPDTPGPRPPVEEPSWRRAAALDHRSLKSRTTTEVGSFATRGRAFHGRDTDGGVGWRLFTVRPGFPKDSPSNLCWVKANLTKDLTDALRVDLTLAEPAPPKMVLTVQGEGGSDGLSGWNLILVPRGAEAVEARLERYDRLVYHTDPVALPPAGDEGRVLSLRLWDGWCSAAIDGAVLFDRVSIHPIPDRHRIGIATWGEQPKLAGMELFRAGR